MASWESLCFAPRGSPLTSSAVYSPGKRGTQKFHSPWKRSVRPTPMSKLREPCLGAWSGGWQVSADTRAPNDFRLPEIENRTWLLKPEPKNRPLHGGGTACVGEVLRGGGKIIYIDGGAVGLAAVG